MAKNDLTLTDVGFGNKVQINGRVYEYKGQDRKKKGLILKSTRKLCQSKPTIATNTQKN